MGNYQKPKKRKMWFTNKRIDLGVGYVWRSYYHPHNTCPRTIPLIKINNNKYNFLKCLSFPKKENKNKIKQSRST